MKNLFILTVCFLNIACTKQYYDEKIANFHNYPYPQPLCIDTNTLFLPDGQFDARSCDTITLKRLSKEAELTLWKKVIENTYELMIRRGSQPRWEIGHSKDSLVFSPPKFFLYGKLDLHPNVKSLILLDYTNDTFFDTVSKELWLINIKDDNLYSIAWLDFYSSFLLNADMGDCFSTVSLKNKIFTTTRICTKYFFNANIGEREWNSYKSKGFAQYRVNENGFVEFVEK